MQKRNLRAGRLLWLGSAAILIAVPFHALLSAWVASNYGHFDVIRLWKEAILLVMAAGSVYMLIRHPALRRDLKDSRLSQAMIVYVAYIVIMAMAGVFAGTVSWRAAVYGTIIDTRYVIMLLVLLVAGHLAPLPVTRRRWIIIPAFVVIAFGLLQMFVLPVDFLRHFGYGPHTLQAFQPVDNKPNLARIQSTLRGPNPLGAYLVPIIMSFVAMAVVSRKRRAVAIVSIVAGVVVLYGSYSRSAALGLVAAGWLFAYWSISKTNTKKSFIVASLLTAIITISLLIGLRQNDSFQNIVFHTNEKSTSSVSSNSARLFAIKNGLIDIKNQPLGRGVGTAGPASLRNTKQTPRIAENYFIQLAQEAGLIGLAMFLAIIGAIGRILYGKRSDVLVRATLASLVGVMVISMVSHALADDTLAYVMAALLGYSLIRTKTNPEVANKLNNKKAS